MTTLICNDKQLPTQLDRHRANALLAALRHGPRFEAPQARFGVDKSTPNSARSAPFSPVLDDLRTNLRRVQMLEAEEALTFAQQQRLARLRREQAQLVQFAKDDVFKEAEWPYVAGLYAIRVPVLQIQKGEELLRFEPYSVFRALDVSDHDPIWPVLKAVLLRQPRGTSVSSAPAFRLQQQRESVLYARYEQTPPTLADWLIGQQSVLGVDTPDFAAGDYIGTKEDMRRDGEVLQQSCIAPSDTFSPTK